MGGTELGWELELGQELGPEQELGLGQEPVLEPTTEGTELGQAEELEPALMDGTELEWGLELGQEQEQEQGREQEPEQEPATDCKEEGPGLAMGGSKWE